MQFSAVIATLSAAVAVQAQTPVITPIARASSTPAAIVLPPPTTVANPNGTVFTTVVNSFTTVCPTPTTITYNSVCYTATTAYQTLTITNCPCTITTTSAYSAASAAKPTAYVQAAGNKVVGGVMGALAAGAGAAALVL
ncbi:hypothetical protein N0V82_005244 [Gnomoniopsis sp. IMI 355080]|nr:hypothetical protein N0V82_005244 [Gnomoniopsis sp. IMI 355080]